MKNYDSFRFCVIKERRKIPKVYYSNIPMPWFLYISIQQTDNSIPRNKKRSKDKQYTKTDQHSPTKNRDVLGFRSCSTFVDASGCSLSTNPIILIQ